MEFKDIFVSLIDTIINLDNDNKYAIKYKNNIDNLKYSDISDFIYDKIKVIENFEDKTFLDFMKIINELKDESFIPGFKNEFIISLDNEKLFKIYYDLVQNVNLNNFKITPDNLTINDMEENIEKSKTEIIKEIEKTQSKEEPDSMMDAVLNMVDTDALNDKIKNLTQDDLAKMGEQVTKILGSNESSKLIGDMVQTIGEELKSQSLEGTKLSEQIKSIADKVSDAYINGTKKTTNEEVNELFNSTQKFVNNFNGQMLNADAMNSILKSYGINKKISQNELNNLYKQMNINPDTMFKQNRKMRRTMNKANKKK